ncbi:D-isomer specific 2-hydroxyacid dehydrogenase family protein [Nakamurella lactea]|uniref:D-isomer specific 2-hydroxyacid dehydrogenase family protein n=1 Tax=Nakamurella lactea TaxID=459515 RepID=UPI00042A1731|nr:D-isomer specific 2-hydroxyacid dehydrogenase family protein [Nakamurella lactea]
MPDNPEANDRPVIAVSDSPPAWLPEAISAGGCQVGPLADADGYVHLTGPASLPHLPARVRWVQLPAAGIETYLADGRLDDRRVWTSAAGAYSETVAEHAVGLLLAGVRGLVVAAGLRTWRGKAVADTVSGLADTTIAVVGAGGIGRRVVEMLAPYRATVIAVNRSGRDVPGADRTVAAADLDELWDQVDHVVIAAPQTSHTVRLIDAAVLARLRPRTWIVNVARGGLIDTDALVDALAGGRIAGAALDVTDPEPLPDGHPLWTTPGVLITPHAANPRAGLEAALADRVRDNATRFASGRDLIGRIDLTAGY